MNERIRELAKQATNYIDPTINGGVCWELDQQKFAQLIVQECCFKLLDMNEKTKGDHNYYKHASLKIKEHFGVEE